jgi:hypothetical protein
MTFNIADLQAARRRLQPKLEEAVHDDVNGLDPLLAELRTMRKALIAISKRPTPRP